ncbi:MAG: DNA mismatch repair protein, partial [Butyricimonas faecihominis]
FGENRNCSYIISSHITEAGYTLRECCDNFKFVYLPTLMRGTIPTYTYRLEEGITNDRHGMMIIDNERIVEIIKGV